MSEVLAIGLFITICLTLVMGYPVAFVLGGVSLLFAVIGVFSGVFDPVFLQALPNRLFGIMNNQTLLAVPLFVFMGVMLEKSRVAEDLLESMSRLFGTLRGGLAISVCVVGALLAASTAVVMIPRWPLARWRRPVPWGRLFRHQLFWCCWVMCSPVLTSKRKFVWACLPRKPFRWVIYLSVP